MQWLTTKITISKIIQKTVVSVNTSNLGLLKLKKSRKTPEIIFYNNFFNINMKTQFLLSDNKALILIQTDKRNTSILMKNMEYEQKLQ